MGSSKATIPTITAQVKTRVGSGWDRGSSGNHHDCHDANDFEGRSGEGNGWAEHGTESVGRSVKR